LPPYTRRKRLKKGSFGYFFDPPTWARERDCPVENEPPGTDYDLAVQRAKKILLPAFDSWLRGGDDANTVGIGVVIGTLDWMFHEYRRTDVGGEKIERRTTVNHAMKTARAAWNTISRAPSHVSAKEPVREKGFAINFARNAAREF